MHGSFRTEVSKLVCQHAQFLSNSLLRSYDFERLHLSVNDMRTAFGGRNPGVTRVIFSNNMLNPWFSHGILSYYGADSYVVNTPGKDTYK